MESVIKWRTGEPKDKGWYLVTAKYGKINKDFWLGHLDGSLNGWDKHLDSDIIAWCPLSEIEPYKE